MTQHDLAQIAAEVFRIPKLVSADDFELVIQLGLQLQTRYRNGEITEERQSDDCWISLRVEHRRQMGRATVSQQSNERLQWLVQQAFRAAEASSADPCNRFPLWKTLNVADERPASLPQRVASVAGEIAPPGLRFEELHRVGSQSTGIWRKSEKQQLYFAKSHSDFSFFIGNVRLSDSSPFWLSEQGALPYKESTSKDSQRDLVDRLISRSVAFQSAVPFSGAVPRLIAFGPGVGAILLREMAPLFTASHYGDSIESSGVFASPEIRIVDDASLSEGAESYPFDLEGVAGQRTVLVERGSPKDLLSDYYWAARRNRLSTGNLRRSVNGSIPEIRPSNLFIEPHPTQTVIQLTSSVASGLYIDAIDSMEVEGTERIVRASGWRIREGKLAEPVFGVPLRVQLIDFLKGATAVANDLRFYGGCGAPSIFFENIPLSV